MLAVAVLAACTNGGDDDVPEGLPTEPFRLEVEVGDCFDRPESPDVTEVPTIDCEQPHDLEAFAVEELPDDSYPGDEAVAEEAQSLCNGSFAEYVGVPPRDSGLVVVPVTPTAESWEAGDRTVTCTATVRADEPLRETIRNSEQPSG